jgi:hypothetical protein
VLEKTHWFEHLPHWHASDASIAPDGSAMDFVSGTAAWRVDLSTGTVEALWTSASTDIGAGKAIRYVDNARAVLLGEKGALLLNRTGNEWTVSHKAKLSKCAQLAYLPEHCLAAVRCTGSTRLTLFVVLSTKLNKLMEDKTLPIHTMVAGGGLLFVASSDKAWMLTGAEEAAAFEVSRYKA